MCGRSAANTIIIVSYNSRLLLYLLYGRVVVGKYTYYHTIEILCSGWWYGMVQYTPTLLIWYHTSVVHDVWCMVRTERYHTSTAVVPKLSPTRLSLFKISNA